MKTDFAAPRAFISYTWENPAHKRWVKEIAVKLRLDGVELLLDQWEVAPGDQLAEFMERAVREGDAVLIVCTPSYKNKSDKRAGGVGYEGSVISAELVTRAPRRKFIPILRDEEWRDAAPSWLLGSVYLDFRNDGAALNEVYGELLETIHGRRETPPPVGSPPLPGRQRGGLSISKKDLTIDMQARGRAEYPHVLVAMLASAPDDELSREAGRRWLLEHGSDNPSWPFVWKALIDSAPEDERLGDLGRRWLLENTSDNSSWAQVWNALMNVTPDGELLRDLGRRWLLERGSE